MKSRSCDAYDRSRNLRDLDALEHVIHITGFEAVAEKIALLVLCEKAS